MKHRFRSWSAAATLVALVAGPAGRAVAQSECGTGGSLRMCVETVDGRDGSANEFNLFNVPVSAAECDANVEVQFTIERIPTDRSVLDFWRSTGTACNETSARTDATMEGCDHLALSADLDIRGPEKVLRIPVQQLVGCAPETTSTFTVFVLAANAAMTTEDVGTAWTSMQVKLDTRAPSAPGSLQAFSGEWAPSVSWVSSEEGLREHRIYVNTAGCGGDSPDGGAADGGSGDGGAGSPDAGPQDGGNGDGGAGSPDAGPQDGGSGDGGAGSPDAGAQDGGAGGGGTASPLPAGCSRLPGAPTAPAGYRLVACVSGTATSHTLDPEALGVPVGTSFGVAVTAVDQARNESDPALTCVARVETLGFCELRGGCPQDCSCSAPGAARPSPLAVAFAALLGLLLWRRRRPSRRPRRGGNR